MPILWSTILINRWLREADKNKLSEVLKPLGIQTTRAAILKQLSDEFLTKSKEKSPKSNDERPEDEIEWTETELKGIYGVTQYTLDCWKIFVQGETSSNSQDPKLLQHLQFLNSQNFPAQSNKDSTKNNKNVVLPESTNHHDSHSEPDILVENPEDIQLDETEVSASSSSSTQTFKGGLYVISTPIGNTQDISLRALSLLPLCSILFCEDSRHTLRLLCSLPLSTRPALSPLHAHTSPLTISKIVAKLLSSKPGTIYGLVSDAGTPNISDPGSALVEKLHEVKYPVYSVPGPCAVTSAVAVSGFSGDKFDFLGFLPKFSHARKKLLKTLREDRTSVFYESPKRVLETLREVKEVLGSERQVCVVRELTKIYEEISRGRIEEILTKFEAKNTSTSGIRGEFTVVIGPKIFN